MSGGEVQESPAVKRQVGGLDVQPDIQGDIQTIATNVSLMEDCYYRALLSEALKFMLIAVCNVAGSCACCSCAQSSVSCVLSMHWLLLLLLSSLWILWREGIPLPLKAPDC